MMPFMHRSRKPWSWGVRAQLHHAMKTAAAREQSRRVKPRLRMRAASDGTDLAGLQADAAAGGGVACAGASFQPAKY